MPKLPELDPLMPRNESAPEISGDDYGSTKRSYATDTTPILLVDPDDDEVGQEGAGTRTTASAQSVTGAVTSALFFAIFIAIVITSFISHAGWEQPNPTPSPIHPIPVPGRPHQPLPYRSIEDRVKDILTETPLIDGHNDLAILIRGVYKNAIAGAHFKDKFENGGMLAQVDLPRLRDGMVGGAFWSAFATCPENASEDFSDEEYATQVAHTLQQIDLLKRLQRQYANNFTAAGNSLEQMLANFHARRSLFGPISIEGLHQLSQTAAMSTLRLYYELGVRAATLTWNCHNAFADAALITRKNSTTIAPYHRGGLTPAGRNVVKEMNRLGMLVDISHTSYWTQKAVLSNGTSKAPVIFTHSSAFSLCPHPRNVKDDILDLVKATNSVVMINFSPDFISCQGDGTNMPEFYQKNNTLHQVARHIVYVGERIGYDHVGLGSDFDGIESGPRGLDGVDKYPDLIAEVLKMGVKDEDASKVVGGNILRVWRDAEQIAIQMRKDGVEPGEDEVSGF